MMRGRGLTVKGLKKLQSQLNPVVGQPVLTGMYISRLKYIFCLFVCFLSPAMPINNQCIKW